MSAIALGRVDWGASKDEDGHRTYSLVTRVETTDVADGPATVMNASGLIAVGTSWALGNDSDSWAYCIPKMGVKRDQAKKGEPHKYWLVTQTFTTKPQNRCQDTSIENPLDEPARISGSFIKYTKEAQKDKDGKLILSSSHERIVGLEKNANRPTVRIELNTAALGLETFSEMVDTLNDAELWGLAARKVMLTNVSWERKIYGTCNYYYTRIFEFEINFDSFDLDDVADKGFKEFDPANDAGSLGSDTAERDDPRNFKVIKDGNEENTPVAVMLDGNGSVNSDPVNSPSFINVPGNGVQLYTESNFLLLGIPTSL